MSLSVQDVPRHNKTAGKKKKKKKIKKQLSTKYW